MGQTDFVNLVVVCDAGPLIHLDELGCLELLADFSQILVPDAVWREVDRHRPGTLLSSSVSFSPVATTTDVAQSLIETARLFALHSGELQALQVALQRRADMLLTDDTAARLAAKQLALPVHGTLGILLRSIRRGQRTALQVQEVLRTLPSVSTLHVKQSLLDEILKTLGKS